jgi:hypothetical protein
LFDTDEWPSQFKQPTRRAIQNQSSWESINAFSLCGELQIDDEEDDAWNLKALVVEKRIERLRRGNTTAEGCKLTIDDLDVKDICSVHDIFNIQMKCMSLSIALGLALKVMPFCGHSLNAVMRQLQPRVNQ